MKKLGVLALATGLLLGVSGCSTEGYERKVYEWTTTLSDGRTLDCITGNGGISCDWANAR